MKLSGNLPQPPDMAVSAVPVRKRWRIGLITAGMAALVAVTVIVTRRYHGATDEALAATARAHAMARQTLKAFLAAETPEERARLVLDGERLLPLMQAYYAGREVDSFPAGDFQPPSWEFNVGGNGLVALELPRARGFSTVAACFKEIEPGRWLMDWDLWTQTTDARFRDFIGRAAEGEYPMHVRLTRCDGSAGAVKLEVADPFNAGQRITFEVTRPDLVELYTSALPNGRSRTATVQLVWLNDSLTGTLQLALRRHICWGFRGLDECPGAPPAIPPSPAPPAIS